LGHTARTLTRKKTKNKNANNSVNTPKSRPIIVNFLSYRNRNKFMYAKNKLKNSTGTSCPDVHITVDLTQL